MRVLCTCLPEYGHFHPMVPLARALTDAGHEVAFATGAELCPRVDRAGFRAFAAGVGFHRQLAEAERRFPVEHALEPGEERFERFVPKMLAGVAAPARAEDLVGVVERWRPDLVVHGEAEFGGPVVAEAAGIPYAAQSVGILRPLAMAATAAEVLAPLCRRFGVDLGPHAGLFNFLYLDVCPPSLQSPEIDQVAVAHQVDAEGKPDASRASGRPYDAAGGEGLPDWVSRLDGAPMVYVTLGTLNRDHALLRTLLQAVGAASVTVVATIGHDNDPAALGAQPTNVHVERYIPQSLLLPHCDAVVNHAGSILPVLGHGLPLLVLPQKANEFHNASACVRAGAGRQLRSGEVTAEAVRIGCRTLLEDPTYRAGARRVQGEIARMPGPDHAVGLLERLATSRRPVTSPAGVPTAAAGGEPGGELRPRIGGGVG